VVAFEKLGFESFDDYTNYFFSTLLHSNKTYEYFVDWEKVKKAANEYLSELSLLNSLARFPLKQRGTHLKKLLITYPKVAEVIPMLIAERARNGQVDVFDPELETTITFCFANTAFDRHRAAKIVRFCRKTGLLKLFDEVKDLYDYLLGVEVGLDSNARKQRSGNIFENMVLRKLKKLLPAEYKIVHSDPHFSLYRKVSAARAKGKVHDIVIYRKDNDKQPVAVVECSFYNVTGSKPISIAESYPAMSEAAEQLGVKFVWVTDGPAWHKMKEPLLRAMQSMKWILNFRMLDRIEIALTA